VNERFKAKLPIPVPIELILVATGTILSHFLNFSDNYGVKTIGYLPLG
jgi:hypothetical protein